MVYGLETFYFRGRQVYESYVGIGRSDADIRFPPENNKAIFCRKFRIQGFAVLFDPALDQREPPGSQYADFHKYDLTS